MQGRLLKVLKWKGLNVMCIFYDTFGALCFRGLLFDCGQQFGEL